MTGRLPSEDGDGACYPMGTKQTGEMIQLVAAPTSNRWHRAQR
jgi:hypothetical protein